MTQTQSLGITVSAWKPMWAYTTSGVEALMGAELHHIQIGDYIGHKLLSYSHTVSDGIGYDTATFELDLNSLDMERWFIEGVGYHVEVRNEAGEIVWEGFVNEVSFSTGSLVATKGPLLEVANRVYVVYQAVDTSTIPPTYGVRTKAIPSINAESQELYGIMPAIVTASGVTSGMVDWVRDMYTYDHAYPAIRKEYGARKGVSLRVSCLGYAHRLNYPYNDLNSGTVALSTKLQSIINATSNGIYSWRNLTTNTMAVPRYEGSDNQANSLIKSLVGMGDAAGARYMFGCWAGRELTYEPISTIINYEQHLSAGESKVNRKGGGEVQPWDVLPGRWIEFTDFLPGFTLTGTELRMNPRCMYIERATFTAPYSIQLAGGDTDILSQKLAQFGLAGR